MTLTSYFQIKIKVNTSYLLLILRSSIIESVGKICFSNTKTSRRKRSIESNKTQKVVGVISQVHPSISYESKEKFVESRIKLKNKINIDLDIEDRFDSEDLEVLRIQKCDQDTNNKNTNIQKQHKNLAQLRVNTNIEPFLQTDLLIQNKMQSNYEVKSPIKELHEASTERYSSNRNIENQSPIVEISQLVKLQNKK